MASVIVESLSNNTSYLIHTTRHTVYQGFQTTDACVLDSAKCFLQKGSNPSGNIVMRVYAHLGTWNSSSYPGTVLATSDAKEASTVVTGQNTFTFSGNQRINLSASTNYCVGVYYAGASGMNVGISTAKPAPGVGGVYNNGWYPSSTWDMYFGVYKDSGVTSPFPSHKT